MAQKNKRKVAHLNRLLNYILGNKPDEFGLVPDKEGYISLKELLKAINEEPNMAYVRESHIREVLLHNRDGFFEITEKKIRSIKRNFTPVDKDQDRVHPPKTLYKGIKRKTYPFILKSGLLPGSKEHIIMTKDKDLAIRIAHRLDQKPIILEINAGVAAENGIPFFLFGDSIYLADKIPVQLISGPPLPKELPSKKETREKEREIISGSFILQAERDPDLMRRKSVKKRIEWKKEMKKGRRRAGLKKSRLHSFF
jgi:putative RNA 2'-phosphotransferase